MSIKSEANHKTLIPWLICLVFAVYLPFVGNPFIFDDLPFFAGNQADHYLHEPFKWTLRWLPYASLAWTSFLFSDVAPHFFHLGNLLTHSINTVLLYFLLIQVISAIFFEEKNKSTIQAGSLIAAAIFAVHPVATYAVGYVIERSILLATLFELLMLLAYLRGLLTGKTGWLALSVLCYFLAVYSKEHSVLAPMVLAVLTTLLSEHVAASKRAVSITFLAFIPIAVSVTIGAREVLGAPYEDMAASIFEQQGVTASTPVLHLLSALTQAGLFFKYLALWLLPNPSWISIDMREQFVTTMTDPIAWSWLIAFIVYGGIAVKLLLKRGTLGVIGFALLFPWLQFGVELTGIRIQEPFVLYRSYLWAPGLLLLIPLLFLRLPQRKAWAIAFCVVLILISISWNRLWILGNKYRLWNDAALLLTNDRAAGADRIYFNRGQALLEAKEWGKAAADFERAANISPRIAPIHNMLGEAYQNAGKEEMALTQFNLAIAIKNDDWRYHWGKYQSLKSLGRKDEAKAELIKSCKLGSLPACILSSSPGYSKK